VPPPETRYARLRGDRIAYQVLGEGPPDLVLTPGSFGHLDIGWSGQSEAATAAWQATLAILTAIGLPQATKARLRQPQQARR
jgi:hypothetical protein